MYPLSFTAPEPQTLLYKSIDPSVPAPEKYTHDPSLQLTHEQQLCIYQKAAAGQSPARKAGRNRECLLLEKLAYTDANNLFFFPAAHALLHRVVKDFCIRALEKVHP